MSDAISNLELLKIQKSQSPQSVDIVTHIQVVELRYRILKQKCIVSRMRQNNLLTAVNIKLNTDSTSSESSESAIVGAVIGGLIGLFGGIGGVFAGAALGGAIGAGTSGATESSKVVENNRLKIIEKLQKWDNLITDIENFGKTLNCNN